MPRGKHNNHRRAEKHPRWNSGRMIASTGYVKLRLGRNHALSDSNGYAYEHLVVWIKNGNAPPKKKEVIHHRNGDKTDNRISNLELSDRSTHSTIHGRGLPDKDVRSIREAYASGAHDMPSLARIYGVPTSRISRFIRGETRKSAGGPISTSNRRAGGTVVGR